MYDIATLGFGPRDQTAHLHLRTTNLHSTASCAANMHIKGWNAGITNMTVREEDVHDRDPAYQGHVSAYLFTPSAFACESLASQLCLPTALTLGRLSLSLSLSAGDGRVRAKSETGLSSPVPDQQRSSSCFPV